MIKLLKSFPYDNQYSYVKGFPNKTAQNSYFNTFGSITINPYGEDDEQGYIKEGESFCIDEEYDYLVSQGINYVIFNNGYKDIYAFITHKEYLSGDTTRLNYEIDTFQTYQFDFSIKQSFIERKVCDINEISDYDEGLNLGEFSIVSDTEVFDKGQVYFAMFSGIKNYEVTVDVDGKITHYAEIPSQRNDAPSTIIDGINYPLFFMPLPSGNIPLSLVDHPSLMGIVRFPQCTYATEQIKIPFLLKTEILIEGGNAEYITVDYLSTIATNINSVSNSGSGGGVSKSEICDFFPYTYYVLTDGETSPLIMKAQELPSSIVVHGEYALSHQPIERFYVSGYKGDNSGRTYNITNSNQMMIPTASREGMAYLASSGASLKMERDNAVVGNVLSGVSVAMNTAGVVAGAVATGGASLGLGGANDIMNGASSVVGGINQIKESDQRLESTLLTPSSISSYGTPSTRNAFGTDNVRVLKYSVNNLIKNKIRNYNLRFGNKYNNYGTIDINNYKGYIKYVIPDIDSKIDNIFINKLITILERGVYIE